MSRLLDKLVTHAAARRVAVHDEAGAHGYDEVLARARAVAAHLGPRHGSRVALLASIFKCGEAIRKFPAT